LVANCIEYQGSRYIEIPSMSALLWVIVLNDLSNVKFVQTTALNIGYEYHGATSGLPIILLHGFPYERRS
jgi:hypothetical protein